MAWLPAENELTLMVALPVLSKGADPTVVAPSTKLTLPDGIPAPGTVTVALKVTVWPKVLGLGVEASAVELGLLLMVSETGADAEPEKLLSPEYVAVILCVPADKEVGEKAALPVLSMVAVPIVIAPSAKVTVPVGIAELLPAAETIADKLSG
jgi:hypothetical protein